MLAESAPARLESEQGYMVARLANSQVELAVIPALGAKLFSLRSLATGREWLWRPAESPRLFSNRLGDAFADSTLIGADECLPTISACTVAGRQLPDHGEVWSAAWMLDKSALAYGKIFTTLRLARSPFTFTRTASIVGATVILDYSLLNHAADRQPYLWALHPLLTLIEGDRLHVPPEVREVLIESARGPKVSRGSWWPWPSPRSGVDLSALTLGEGDASAKFFLGPLASGTARIENLKTGDRIEFRWPVAANPFLGIWLNRGGWLGAHHPAIEPTNAPCDALSDALQEPAPRLFIEAGETRRWQVVIDVAPVVR